ncbi:MAG: SAM-dependent methyltransferase [Candidatus Altiarchaeales archaeon WOR_SM1_79]|nr:MAG: SAM-dependent methyltransferase [Candidatus Altiarchaeales archaeon WOR_SM1_79]
MKSKNKKYIDIVSHYEYCLEKHGDTHLGVDWPKIEDVDKRYEIMLDVINCNINSNTPDKIRLLDFGCGASHLYEYMVKHKINDIEYNGLDLSKKFINLSKKKFPFNKYYYVDILEDDTNIPNFDYIVMNGVFTEKRNLSFDEMFDYFKKVVKKVFGKAEKGITFNVMSKQVDWEREDLFHLPLDLLADFLTKNISRKFIIRNDYGLYEYTAYVYKEKI